ncbi:MAG TPA: trypsin-like peptidase domain-containing protein [Micromonosporaceae bacterium]|nr:trypsin-like peptidase domain-containing protein [Micromonosporaceae bacterium]
MDHPVDAGSPAPARRRNRWIAAAAVAAALAITAAVAFRWGSSANPAAEPVPAPSPTPSADAQLSTAEIYSALAPSVVTVEAVNPSTGRVESTGTGVVASADGTIVTALHVVSGAGSIRVTFADGTPSRARLVGADSSIDIAILAPSDLPTIVVPATLGNPGRLAVGDTVVAIGNQLGLTSSATEGVVSGLDRSARGEDGTRLTGLIQFDAAVNPGSSGGPLVNARAELVGIVVALANPTDDRTFIGIGFAVPIGTAVAAGAGGGPQQ